MPSLPVLQRFGTYLGAVTNGQTASQALDAALALFPGASTAAEPVTISRNSPAPAQRSPARLSPSPARSGSPGSPASPSAHHSPSPGHSGSPRSPAAPSGGRHLLQVRVWPVYCWLTGSDHCHRGCKLQGRLRDLTLYKQLTLLCCRAPQAMLLPSTSSTSCRNRRPTQSCLDS